MRFATYSNSKGVPTWGAEVDGVLYDLGPSGLAVAGSLREAIASSILAGINLDAVVGVPATSADSARFLPLIPDPAKIICVGVNYREHSAEAGRPTTSVPTVFTRFADSQMGHGQPAVRPATTTQFDYEGELVVIIGAPAHNVTADDAPSVIAGYSIYNDFSARDWQRATTQWIAGKNFPATGGFGPYLVLADDVPDVSALDLETRVNGERRQSASLSDLVFSVPELIEYVTGFTALAPGDVLVTGTPGGVGLFMEPSGLLSEGDVVEVEITGLGTLRNVVEQG